MVGVSWNEQLPLIWDLSVVEALRSQIWGHRGLIRPKTTRSTSTHRYSLAMTLGGRLVRDMPDKVRTGGICGTMSDVGCLSLVSRRNQARTD